MQLFYTSTKYYLKKKTTTSFIFPKSSININYYWLTQIQHQRQTYQKKKKKKIKKRPPYPAAYAGSRTSPEMEIGIEATTITISSPLSFDRGRDHFYIIATSWLLGSVTYDLRRPHDLADLVRLLAPTIYRDRNSGPRVLVNREPQKLQSDRSSQSLEIATLLEPKDRSLANLISAPGRCEDLFGVASSSSRSFTAISRQWAPTVVN